MTIVASHNKIRDFAAAYPKKERPLIEKACLLSLDLHEKHQGGHGVLSFDHCLKMNSIFQELSLDTVTVLAGLFHDLYEYEDDLAPLEDELGRNFLGIVKDYGQISRFTHETQVTANADEYIRMVLSVSEDIRTVLLFLVDRYFKIKYIDEFHKLDRNLLAERTLTAYAPLAHRLGLGRFKAEMENFAFEISNPDFFGDLEKKMVNGKFHHEQYIDIITMKLRLLFEQHRLKSDLTGRAKHLLSIYRKMKRTGRSFEQIYDVLAVRAIVKSVTDCYKALAIVQQQYTPIMEEFDDYIQRPKMNGYQSLHVLLEDDEGIQFELQIRTHNMHKTAEYGVAAHWQYKEGKANTEVDQFIKLLREHSSLNGDASESAAVTRFFNIKDRSSDIYVMTPAGDLKRLPQGSTPIDFAFSVHREVGLHCSGARVNGQMVPFETVLQNGDRVEVMTAPNPTINADWAKYAHSQKAKTQIRKWHRDQMRLHSRKLGEELLAKGFRKNKISITKTLLSDICTKLKFEKTEDLYESIGMGKNSIQTILQRMYGEQEEQAKEVKPAARRKSPQGILVGGMDNLMVSFGKCCLPIPGDPIVGYITRGKGVTVHRTICRNASMVKSNPERQVDVEWESEPTSRFYAGIRAVLSKTEQFIKDASARIGKKKISIVNHQMYKESGKNYCTIVLEVPDRAELESYMSGLKKMKIVQDVYRLQYSEYKLLLRKSVDG